jgi:protein-S-isoprenylcysteine O-methyltransferase Ste14
MDDWEERQPPAPDWDRQTRMRNRLNQIRREKPGFLWAGVAIVAAGLLLAVVSLQLQLGLLQVVSAAPLFFLGCLVTVAGLGVLAFTFRSALD